MIEVINTIELVENKSSTNQEEKNLVVNNHWNDDKLIVLQIGYIRIVVKAKDLRAAIDNATNTVRF